MVGSDMQRGGKTERRGTAGIGDVVVMQSILGLVEILVREAAREGTESKEDDASTEESLLGLEDLSMENLLLRRIEGRLLVVGAPMVEVGLVVVVG